MGAYERFVLPHLLALAMRSAVLVPFRKRVGSAASGRVLEIGVGPGLNLPFYGPDVREVIGIDPLLPLLRMAQARGLGTRFPVELVEALSEQLPIDSKSIDTAVTTWTMCSVRDPASALREVARVLRPGGTLLFVEHGRAPDARVRWWQDALTPTWRRVAGGCHLNRPIEALISQAGFRTEGLHAAYVPGPKPFAYMYEGSARPE